MSTTGAGTGAAGDFHCGIGTILDAERTTGGAVASFPTRDVSTSSAMSWSST